MSMAPRWTSRDLSVPGMPAASAPSVLFLPTDPKLRSLGQAQVVYIIFVVLRQVIR